MEIKRGHIYWIYRDEKRPVIGSCQDPGPGRPGIIVSNDFGNHYSPTYEVVFLTKAPKNDLPTHCTITSSEYLSTALCENITTVSEKQVGKWIGVCSPDEMLEVNRCLAISLGLDAEPAIEPEEDIESLRREIARRKAREELLQELYNNLLHTTRA